MHCINSLIILCVVYFLFLVFLLQSSVPDKKYVQISWNKNTTTANVKPRVVDRKTARNNCSSFPEHYLFMTMCWRILQTSNATIAKMMNGWNGCHICYTTCIIQHITREYIQHTTCSIYLKGGWVAGRRGGRVAGWRGGGEAGWQAIDHSLMSLLSKCAHIIIWASELN